VSVTASSTAIAPKESRAFHPPIGAGTVTVTAVWVLVRASFLKELNITFYFLLKWLLLFAEHLLWKKPPMPLTKVPIE
jgi:hypothetical protein